MLALGLAAGCQTASPSAPQAGGAPAMEEGPPDNRIESRVGYGQQFDVELVAEPVTISPGERVTSHVQNHGRIGITYGLPITAERWDGDAWVETEDSRNTAWTMQLLYTAPGRSGPEQHFPLLPEQRPEPGWYRLTKHIQPENAQPGDAPVALRVRVRVTE